MDRESIREALKDVKYPGFSRDIVGFGLVDRIETEGGSIYVGLRVTTSDATVPKKLKDATEERLRAIPGAKEVKVEISVSAPKGTPARSATPGSSEGARAVLPDVKWIVAVASGKGGVGKSTVAVNLAMALSETLRSAGYDKGVGIMDCDIYGPSVPLMMGIHERPEIQDNQLIPPRNFGLSVMSMALLVDESAPVVWRGPMVNSAIQQFVQQVRWGELDLLVVDLPPGTGDAQLSLVQTLPVSGAVIVTTPQVVATQVTQRGARLFDKVEVPLLGVVENMSYYEMPDGQKVAIFGEEGGKRTADSLQTPLLARIPIDVQLREGCDRGIPVVISHPDGPASQAFKSAADQILAALSSQQQGNPSP